MNINVPSTAIKSNTVEVMNERRQRVESPIAEGSPELRGDMQGIESRHVESIGREKQEESVVLRYFKQMQSFSFFEYKSFVENMGSSKEFGETIRDAILEEFDALMNIYDPLERMPAFLKWEAYYNLSTGEISKEAKDGYDKTNAALLLLLSGQKEKFESLMDFIKKEDVKHVFNFKCIAMFIKALELGGNSEEILFNYFDKNPEFMNDILTHKSNIINFYNDSSSSILDKILKLYEKNSDSLSAVLSNNSIFQSLLSEMNIRTEGGYQDMSKEVDVKSLQILELYKKYPDTLVKTLGVVDNFLSIVSLSSSELFKKVRELYNQYPNALEPLFSEDSNRFYIFVHIAISNETRRNAIGFFRNYLSIVFDFIDGIGCSLVTETLQTLMEDVSDNLNEYTIPQLEELKRLLTERNKTEELGKLELLIQTKIAQKKEELTKKA